MNGIHFVFPFLFQNNFLRFFMYHLWSFFIKRHFVLQSFHICYLTKYEFVICNHPISFDFTSCIIVIFHSSSIFQTSKLPQLWFPSTHMIRSATINIPFWIELLVTHYLQNLNQFRNTNFLGPSWDFLFWDQNWKKLSFINPKRFPNLNIIHPFSILKTRVLTLQIWISTNWNFIE